MSDGRLVIGNRRYSSWSLRGWMAVRLAGLKVTVTTIPMTRVDGAGATPAIKAVAPAGLVPFLEHQGALVWESLAICEYCAELAPALWPADRAARGTLRSIATEMHGGFLPLRRAFPMNLGARASTAVRDARMSAEIAADLTRIAALWAQAIALTGGPFLNGAAPGAADAMYAPVVNRIHGWNLTLPPAASAYVEALLAHPAMREWQADADAEPAEWILPHYEAMISDEQLR
ncbi:glutathione S-transferase [Humitalea rosea]|uniref:Glutathione S-transferase n=1 Tax=Humitalea rosea TaxID=990373 RepID=A0A2W7KBA0_9PROT|nr:glutathione S-transferase N-terminal domain-containing protein [Humitalea rosea]PZW44890.1 glutathione S-transferase [Humitalea rosea]